MREVGLAVDVVVERRGPDPESVGDQTDAEPVEADLARSDGKAIGWSRHDLRSSVRFAVDLQSRAVLAG